MSILALEETTPSDEELISRIKKGDAQSFDILIRTYFPKIHRRVQALVPAEDAEDVTQDIFLNLVRSIYSFEGKSAFATWFSRIASNRIADYYRRSARQKARFASEDEMARNEPLQEANNDLEMEDLLMNLPEHYREVITMKLCQNLSFGEIASALKLSYEAARSRYRRGIRYAATAIDFEELLP